MQTQFGAPGASDDSGDSVLRAGLVATVEALQEFLPGFAVVIIVAPVNPDGSTTEAISACNINQPSLVALLETLLGKIKSPSEVTGT